MGLHHAACSSAEGSTLHGTGTQTGNTVSNQGVWFGFDCLAVYLYEGYLMLAHGVQQQICCL